MKLPKKYIALVIIFFLIASPVSASIDSTSQRESTSDESIGDGTTPGEYPFEDEYPSFQQLTDWYDDLVYENPDITEKIDIGDSWEGRDIWAIKVSDNVEEEEDEPSVFIHGNIHAREWSTNQVTAYYLWKIVEDYGSNETITWLVNNRQIYVAPTVNPDGYVHDGNGDLGQKSWWRKNRNDSTPTSYVGVDLNRNWDIDWENGDDDPSSNTYHGEAPFSEYETQDLREFILSKDIDSYNDIHSYAGTLLIPWAHTTSSCPHDSWYRDMADDMTSMTSQMGDESEQYSYGQPGEEIGYSASGGSYDWVYDETGAIGLSYELYTGGSGFYPPEDDIMDINQDVYDSLVYQTRIAELDLGDGDNDLHPPSPYILYGTVEDDEGDPLVKTNVTIENIDTEEIIYKYTDSNGYYELNFGNFVKKGYDSSDTFSIQAGSFSTNFTIGDEWGQRKDLENVEVNSPSVNLTEPSEGGSSSVGDEMSIEWETEEGDAPITGVDLEYTTAEKEGWSTIEEGMENTGLYNWTVPGEPTSDAKVRVTVYDGNYLNDTDTSDSFNITLQGVPDVPNWGIGSSWDHDQNIWMDQSGGGSLTMNESITYTVADIGNHEYNGSTYYSYNLSLQGDIQDGEGEFDGYPIEIEDGKIEGYMLVRVSDLGVIVDHQYRDIDGYVDVIGSPQFDAFVNLTRYYHTVVEDYDFPLWRDETFWANTTVESFGDYKFEDESGLIKENEEFHEVEEINQTNQVSSELKDVQVPAGTYTTYEVKNTMENETSKLGYMNSWYNDTVGWFVKQNSYFPSEEFEADIERKLTNSSLQIPDHTQEIQPNPQSIGSDITISGHMEGYSNATLSISIPYSLGRQNWRTKTNSTGYYELTIQVPHIKDNTPTHSYYSSEGIVSYVEDHKSEKIVSTLVVRMETYELEINSTEGGEVVEPGENTYTYDYGTEVDIKAVAEDHYHFVGWTGEVEGINDPVAKETKIEMLDDYSITAEFAIDTYELTVQSTEGGEVIDPGEGIFKYDHGETVNLKAVAEDHYHFAEWTGDTADIDDTTSDETTVTMMDNYTIMAEFEKVYDLTIEAPDNGTVISPGEGTFTYKYGTEVGLEAVPDEGYRFVGWTGDIDAIADINDNETKIMIEDDYAITAEFEKGLVEHELTINLEGNGTVKVEWNNESFMASAEETFLIEEGTEVTLTADPDENWEFVEWNGYDEEGEEITISIDEDMEITAHFSEEDGEGGATPGFSLPLLMLGTVITMVIYYKKER